MRYNRLKTHALYVLTAPVHWCTTGALHRCTGWCTAPVHCELVGSQWSRRFKTTVCHMTTTVMNFTYCLIPPQSIVSYARSVFLQSNKKIFDVNKLPLDEFAQSLGLPNPPRIRFLKKAEKKYGKPDEPSQIDVTKLINQTQESSGSSDEETGDNESNDEGDLGKTSKEEDDTAEQDDLLVLKKRHVDFDLGPPSMEEEMIVFDEEGEPLTTEGVPLDVASTSEPTNQNLEPVPLGESHQRHVGGISVEESRDMMREADLIDRKVERQRIKSKHKEQRRKSKKRRREEQGVAGVSLADDGEDQEELEDSEEEQPISPKKRKRLPKKNRASDIALDLEPQGPSLAEDEELVLQLLSGS
ncbi:ATPdependent RNA helicase [Desmophyllum pertusum]|uniref:ATPdependent RNA helicase n=1 Tax=Desmophyllum pertusum TaxID=174260 RepID=A0A9X0DDQ0_9CNID|nr:ATPdependent RNA helicase [Desmophyllum pertusum]